MDINQQEDFQNEIEAQELKVATRIQEKRLARKLSQLDLALEAGISQGYLAMVESHQKIPTITTIFKIARALNISPIEFFRLVKCCVQFQIEFVSPFQTFPSPHASPL